MDLHLTDALATEDERDALDSLLGPPATRWEGGARASGGEAHVAHGGHAARARRHLLLPALHALRDRVGWLSPGAVNYLAQRLTVPPADIYGVASFYALFDLEATPPTVVHLCDDIACTTRGASELIAACERAHGPEGRPCAGGGATWKRSPCLGLCELAPAALIQRAGAGREHATMAPADAGAVADALAGRPVEPRAARALPQQGETSLRLLARVGVADPSSLEDYRRHGGYRALARALEIGPEGVIHEVVAARLVGRGGAAFPTDVKWRAVAGAAARPRYVVCNADESEPGTFKDRVLMEDDPFAVVEALTIAGFAVGADQGWIYIRGEYPEAHQRLAGAIARARQAGLLGRDVLGRAGFHFDVELRRGAGAYICGEETALFNSIEGYRGEPRNKPPFPVSEGLFGKPTAINNVETLANVLLVLAEGGEAFASVGTEGSRGPKLLCVSGCVERPGLYEVAFGVTLRALLERAGGVRGGRPLRAALIGGASGSFVTAEQLDMPLTLEGTRAHGASLGSGVVLVFDDRVDLEAIVLRIARFFRDESCGQCVPCRVGTVRQEESLRRLAAGRADRGAETVLLAELDRAMRDASICGLGQTAAIAVRSAVDRLGLFSGARP
ncbi:MAG TPA: NAD(P)H-dependent oxidoreductase subunit E [Candidatus Acidoferrales bacterium]|nr:NAD(P)H-dependent oxidoreductase subunit E [Candidatus Acidoferrales bacterium]